VGLWTSYRTRFQELKGLDAMSLRRDAGILLLADEKSLGSLVEPTRKIPSNLWAVYVTLSPGGMTIRTDARGSLRSGVML
jgi:hypothetical protein